MKSSRITCFLGLLFSLSLVISSGLQQQSEARSNDPDSSSLLKANRFYDSPSSISSYHGGEPADSVAKKPSAGSRGGIKEEISAKHKAQYQKWKQQFLSTEIGKEQWQKYESNTEFTLTINVSGGNSRGASTGSYEWDDSGKLVAATITLGSNLQEGYPNPIYYPVMNSLMRPESTKEIDGDVLAATKMAHEFGHLNYTANADSSRYKLQVELMPVYNKIFLSNGRKVNDPRLVELVEKMGGTPVEIWEDREYWGEANAMIFIRDKFKDNDMRCSLFNRIKQSVDLYAKNYEDRFLKIVQSAHSPNDCGW